MKKTAIVLGIIIIILLGVLIFVPPVKEPVPSGGGPSPAVSSDGHLTVTLPYANDLVASPLHAEGTVTGGGWFFEASFPVKILDGDGTVLGQGPAQAQGEWMSTGTVPFGITLPFTAPKYATGTIVFMNDNPSGLPANQKELRIQVRFK